MTLLRLAGPATGLTWLLLLAPATAAQVPSGSAPADGQHWPYVVAKGDTLIGFARSRLVAGADWRVVQRLNRIANPFRLQPGSTLLVPWELVPGTPAAATVQHVHGQVQRQRAGSGAMQPLQAGDRLVSGDVLVSGAQSSASLRLADGTRLLLRPDSRLVLDRLERQGGPSGAGANRYSSRLTSPHGALDAAVPVSAAASAAAAAASTPAAPTWRQLQIRTPVANLGVRGTSFRVRVDAGTSFFEVLEGEVRTAAFEALPSGPGLTAGQGQVATAQGLQAARTLLPAPVLVVPPGPRERPAGEALEFAWTASTAAPRGWRAQLFDVSPSLEQPVLRLDGVFDASLARWPDALVAGLPSGDYELRVRGVDEQGLEGEDSRLKLVLAQLPPRPPPPPPAPPPVVAPAGVVLAAAQFGTDGVLLRWQAPAGNAVDRPLRYRLQVAADAAFQAPLHLELETDQRSHLLPTLPAGRWHWRVRAEATSADGRSPVAGPYSTAQTFDLRLPFARLWFAPGELRVVPAEAEATPARP
jgi:hypothetical protein